MYDQICSSWRYQKWTFGYTWIRNIGCRSLVWPFYVLEVKHQRHIQKYVKIWITEGKVHKARQQNIALSLRKLFFTRDQCAHNIRTHKVSSKPSFGTTTRTALQGSKTVLKHGKLHHFFRNLRTFGFGRKEVKIIRIMKSERKGYFW